MHVADGWTDKWNSVKSSLLARVAYNLCQHQQHTIFQCIIVLSLSLHPEVHCVQKNKTRIIFNILYSCKSIADLQWNLACDILMILAIKRIHNLPPHLSYVSTLPDVIQNRNTALTSWSKSSLTLRTIFLRASSMKPVANMAACMCKAKGRHFESLNTCCDLATQPAQIHFRHIETSSFQSHSHYWEEDNIILPFLCNVR